MKIFKSRTAFGNNENINTADSVAERGDQLPRRYRRGLHAGPVAVDAGSGPPPPRGPPSRIRASTLLHLDTRCLSLFDLTTMTDGRIVAYPVQPEDRFGQWRSGGYSCGVLVDNTRCLSRLYAEGLGDYDCVAPPRTRR